ncbi:hypothetical protein [Tissierella simiarum]|uniref:hypothetical protein n=1 Tax=Tissierella simiarum TaxID=2841534 RepID=UPI001FEBADA6|nr:hypothetical protein [Tissierella simiarum]
MASREQLRKIALYCDSYTPRENTELTSSADSYEEKFETCIKCGHYTREGKCDLDLVDKVLSSMAMELDLKR